MKVVIIGAGAAGCFAAIEIKRRRPDVCVTVLERGPKALAKVAVTGGGRCNITNSFAGVRSMEQVYPRGHRLMKRLLHHFSYQDTFQWFEHEGVPLVTQSDECVFPRSQDAMQVVDTLLGLMHSYGVCLVTGCTVQRISPSNSGYRIDTSEYVYTADRVLVAAGGQPRLSCFNMLSGLDIDIVPPVPSLFSLSIADQELTSLMGTVVEQVQLSLVGTKIRTSGALLITHWGISGPATLRLSSIAARMLAECNYTGIAVSINWMSCHNSDEVLQIVKELARLNAQKQLHSAYPTELNARLWRHLLQRASMSQDTRWRELHGKGINRIVNILTNDIYNVIGKNRFKEEFVTCGGVALGALRPDTLESRQWPGLYFAGEVTDVDAVTGGFNLQAAWTMGYVAARAIAQT